MLFKKAMGWYENAQVFQMKLEDRWYLIARRNIRFIGSLQKQADLINATLKGLVCRVKGVYSRERRELTLEL